MKAQVLMNTVSVTRPKKQLALQHTRGVKDAAHWLRTWWLVSEHFNLLWQYHFETGDYNDKILEEENKKQKRRFVNISDLNPMLIQIQ